MLLLDSEALSAIAHGPVARRDRVRALVQRMRDLDRPVGTSAAVLAEVLRGRPADAAVFSVLGRERVQLHDVRRPTGVRAGQLLEAASSGSKLAVDAFLVATADLAGGGLIASVDLVDLERLAAPTAGVAVVDIT